MDNDVPVCVLSARSSVDDRVAGLEAGADDYLVKPFVLAELVGPGARAAAPAAEPPRRRLRKRFTVGPAGGRHPGPAGPGSTGVDVDLTKREFDLLAVLAEHKTAVAVTRTAARAGVGATTSPADTNVVDVFIGYLRRKPGGRRRPPGCCTPSRGVGFVLRFAVDGTEHELLVENPDPARPRCAHAVVVGDHHRLRPSRC